MHYKYTVRRCGQGLEQWICECGWRSRTDILPDTARQEFNQHVEFNTTAVVPPRVWMTVGDVKVYHEESHSVRVCIRPKP